MTGPACPVGFRVGPSSEASNTTRGDPDRYGLQKLARRAQQIYTERGGAEAARGDAGEVRHILEGEGTLLEKAKAAAKALKEPGAAPEQVRPTPPSAAPTEPPQSSSHT